MALNDYVTVNITQATSGITRAGFGTGMYLSYVAAWTELTRTYKQLSDVATDFPHTTGPEYRAASAYFSQSPRPKQLIIGRGTLKPTKVVSLSALSPTAALNYVYVLNVSGDNFTDAQVTYTSDGTPTDAEWAAGIVTALNGVSGKNNTAAGASSPVTITGTNPGDWFCVEIVDVNHMTLTETTTDPGVATDLTAISLENPNWYALYTAFNSKAFGKAAAGYCESAKRIYVADTNDTHTVLVAYAPSGENDLMEAVRTNAYSRTLCEYHPRASVMMGAALLGARLATSPGSETWTLAQLAGVPTYIMTPTHRANIVARHGNGYELAAGLNVTFNGMVGNGNFLDVARGLDFFVDDAQKALFGTMVSPGKVPQTDDGYTRLEAQLRGALKRSEIAGVFAAGWQVFTVAAVDVSDADRAARVYNGLTFSARLQGAVQAANVNGNVTA